MGSASGGSFVTRNGILSLALNDPRYRRQRPGKENNGNSSGTGRMQKLSKVKGTKVSLAKKRVGTPFECRSYYKSVQFVKREFLGELGEKGMDPFTA